MKILIIKTSALGDIVQAYPVLQYFRRYYPKAQIDWVVEEPCSELVRAHPHVNEVLIVRTRKWRRGWRQKDNWNEVQSFRRQLQRQTYDIVLDLQGNTKSGLMTWLAKGNIKVGFALKAVPEWPNILFTNKRINPPLGKNKREDYLFLAQSATGNFSTENSPIKLTISAKDQQRIDEILASPKLRGEPLIMVCPGSNWVNKQLPLHSLKPLIIRMKRDLKGKFVYVWGTPDEKAKGEGLAQLFPEDSLLIDRLALPVLQNLMSHMNLVIAMDSMALHLAGTTRTRTFGVFGPSLGYKYKPLGEKHEVFQGACPYGRRFDTRCKIMRTCSTGSCINTINDEDLYSQFIEWWQQLP